MTKAQDEYEARRRHAAARPIKKGPIPTHLREHLHRQPCAVCARRVGIEVHHIVPRSAFSKRCADVHDPDNLMPLCNVCHVGHHTRGTDNRVPRHALTTAQITFILGKKGPGWMQRWYPELEPNPGPTPHPEGHPHAHPHRPG